MVAASNSPSDSSPTSDIPSVHIIGSVISVHRIPRNPASVSSHGTGGSHSHRNGHARPPLPCQIYVPVATTTETMTDNSPPQHDNNQCTEAPVHEEQSQQKDVQLDQHQHENTDNIQHRNTTSSTNSPVQGVETAAIASRSSRTMAIQRDRGTDFN